jgi:hypothetical protein
MRVKVERHNGNASAGRDVSAGSVRTQYATPYSANPTILLHTIADKRPPHRVSLNLWYPTFPSPFALPPPSRDIGRLLRDPRSCTSRLPSPSAQAAYLSVPLRCVVRRKTSRPTNLFPRRSPHHHTRLYLRLPLGHHASSRQRESIVCIPLCDTRVHTPFWPRSNLESSPGLSRTGSPLYNTYY